ncbi:hypothetical protein PHISCL_08147 [Aspergillus sclerotialis]|uniref:Uncharacterized protein n=1 Tax=Aspergillus sclerotialis TaxID=2070753 RepID=A0A3A2ZB93_9EURO|nr:hypothetical protein PHISCL_08147 [Aspergillus sclerotialis]
MRSGKQSGNVNLRLISSVSVNPGVLKQLERLSRLGGPDLSNLRGYPEPDNVLDGSMGTIKSISRKRKTRSRAAKGITTTAKTTTYSRNLRQHLIDYAIYPYNYEYPDGQVPALPNNWDEINQRLARRRPSLSPLQFSEKDFKKFCRDDAYASKEKIVTEVIPTIEGRSGDPKYRGGFPFGNLDPLTDGTLPHATPDHFYGARPEPLDLEIRKKLSNQIIPSTQSDLPMAPNFFLEAKGPDGTQAVAERQAVYNGALGARAIHALQSYQQESPVFDNNAYMVTSIYIYGQLRLYTAHISKPRGTGCRPEYIITQLNSWSMTGNIESFRQGASAYRNALDWAKETRDEMIRLANRRHLNAQSRLPV